MIYTCYQKILCTDRSSRIIILFILFSLFVLSWFFSWYLFCSSLRAHSPLSLCALAANWSVSNGRTILTENLHPEYFSPHITPLITPITPTIVSSAKFILFHNFWVPENKKWTIATYCLQILLQREAMLTSPSLQISGEFFESHIDDVH